MAIENEPTKVRKPVYLPSTGPEKVGVLPAATAPPTRPVTRKGDDSTNSKSVTRPAQGRANLHSTFN